MGDLSALAWALRLAEQGYLIFPLRPGSKEPWVEGSWKDQMTSDSATIRGWFEYRPNMNYAVNPGPSGVIIDLDEYKQSDGVEEFKLLDMESDTPICGETFEVKTPSGGRHLYLKTEHPVGNAHRLPKGIDVRGSAGYVVGPGCNFEGNTYEVIRNREAVACPGWIAERFTRDSGEKDGSVSIVGDLDTESSVQQAKRLLQQRAVAVEGQGGDAHTYATAQLIIDYGISTDKAVELLCEYKYSIDGDEPRSWNDRCEPPWDAYGERGTLEEKCDNAWRYRNKNVGEKSTGFEGGQELSDEELAEYEQQELIQKQSKDGLLKHIHFGGELFERNKKRETVIPGYIPGQGVTGILAKRGIGKTAIMVDMAMRVAHDMEWHGEKVKKGLTVIYVCGEDDVGAEDMVRAWCIKHEIEKPDPLRFVFVDTAIDFLEADNVRVWAETLHGLMQGRKCITFIDTWQRMTSKASQSDDKEMQTAMHHAEALARSLNGPMVASFHPPKADETTTAGSSVIENELVCIMNIFEGQGGKKLEVTRIKGAGLGNYKIFKLKQWELNVKDEFGDNRTHVVPELKGGTEGGNEEQTPLGDDLALVEQCTSIKEALSYLIRELEIRRKDVDPKSKRPYTALEVSAALEQTKDEATLFQLSELGIELPIKQNLMANFIVDQFQHPYNFGDGYVLKIVGNDKRLTIAESDLGKPVDSGDHIF